MKKVFSYADAILYLTAAFQHLTRFQVNLVPLTGHCLTTTVKGGS